jgi:hypothetical protein
MSKRDVAELTCRILALYYLVANLHSLIGMPLTLGMGGWSLIRHGGWDVMGIGLLFTALATGFVIVLVWFLWTRAWWIANKLVPDDANYSRWPRLRAADLQVVAFSTIGLITLVNSIRFFARSFGLYITMLNSDRFGERRMTFFEWLIMEDTLASLVGCVVGLWLVLGSRGLVRLIRRLRRPQFDESAEESSTDPSAAANLAKD